MVLLIRLLLLFVWLSVVACSDVVAPEAYSETRIVPAGQTYRITAPSATNTVDIVLVGAGGQANWFIAGSGGGYIVVRRMPFTLKDEMFAFVAKANPSGTEGWIRASGSAVRTRLGLLFVEAGTSYLDPGVSFYDEAYGPYVEKAGPGQPAVGETRGCGFQTFGCGGWGGIEAKDGHLELHFYTR